MFPNFPRANCTRKHQLFLQHLKLCSIGTCNPICSSIILDFIKKGVYFQRQHFTAKYNQYVFISSGERFRAKLKKKNKTLFLHYKTLYHQIFGALLNLQIFEGWGNVFISKSTCRNSNLLHYGYMCPIRLS